MAENNHKFPQDCPFVGDHDALTKMATKIDSINEGINGDYGILAQLKALNGKTQQNEKDIAKITTVGMVAVVLIPILIRILWP